MKKGCFICSEGTKDLSLLLLRVSVGVLFVFAGWGKLQAAGATEGPFQMFQVWFGGAGVALFWLVAFVEFIGGIALVLGIYTRVAAKLLAITMLVALVWVHFPAFAESGFSPAMQMTIALLGASFGIMGAGNGKYALTQKDCVCSK